MSNSFLGKMKQIITLIDPETDFLLDEKQSANHTNDFFVSLTKDFTEVKDDWSNRGITESLPVISEESVAKKLEGLHDC